MCRDVFGAGGKSLDPTANPATKLVILARYFRFDRDKLIPNYAKFMQDLANIIFEVNILQE